MNEKKRVLVLGAEGLGAGIRSEEMIKALGKSNFEVKVMQMRGFSPRSFHGIWRCLFSTFNSTRDSSSEGVLSLKDLLSLAGDPQTAYLLMKGQGFGQQLLRVADKFDLIVAETTFMGIFAKLLKEDYGIPYVLDMHGLYAKEYAGLHEHDNHRIERVFEKLERSVVQEAARVIAVSETMKQFVCTYYNKSSKNVIVHRNGTRAYGKVAKFGQPVRFVFGGAFTYWERPQDFLALAQVLGESDCTFKLFGEGPLRKELANSIREKSLRIEFGKSVSRQDAMRIFSESHIGVAPSSTDIARQVAWPIKIMDYAACGLPILAQDVGEWSGIISSYGMGECVDFANHEELAKVAQGMCSKSEWERMSRNAIDAAKGPFSWDVVFEDLSSTVDI